MCHRADVLESNVGAARAPFKEGAATYKDAVRMWIKAKRSNEIRPLA